MNQIVTEAIVLTRTDFGEADRILTLLTPEQGKLRLIAKGVRRVKSKLAGGIELFSVTNLSYIKGRGEIGTLVSSRLEKHYGNIVKDIDRTMLGYALIKQIHKATEDEPEPEYFTLLQQSFEALDDAAIPLSAVQLSFSAQLLLLGGYGPNLRTDIHELPLAADQTYDFSFDDSAFAPRDGGLFRADHIKYLRLVFGNMTARGLSMVQKSSELSADCLPLVTSLCGQYIRG